MKKPKTIEEYINGAPSNIKPKLLELTKIIAEAAPKAIGKISYGMPYYGYKGRLVYFAYFKKHIGLYIMPRFLEDFEDEIKEIKTGRATLQLPLDKEIPAMLIKQTLKNAIKIIDGKK